MWYSDGDGGVFVAESTDGEIWSAPSLSTGLGSKAHHVQVVYDPNGFHGSSGYKYKIWYWNKPTINSIDAIFYAESIDGIQWEDNQSISQDENLKLVTGTSGNWNKGS
jgi:hypothetical protein